MFLQKDANLSRLLRKSVRSERFRLSGVRTLQPQLLPVLVDLRVGLPAPSGTLAVTVVGLHPHRCSGVDRTFFGVYFVFVGMILWLWGRGPLAVGAWHLCLQSRFGSAVLSASVRLPD